MKPPLMCCVRARRSACLVRGAWLVLCVALGLSCAWRLACLVRGARVVLCVALGLSCAWRSGCLVRGARVNSGCPLPIDFYGRCRWPPQQKVVSSDEQASSACWWCTRGYDERWFYVIVSCVDTVARRT